MLIMYPNSAECFAIGFILTWADESFISVVINFIHKTNYISQKLQ